METKDKKPTGEGASLPKNFSGSVARMERGKVIGVHKAQKGQTLCGTDVTTITPNLVAHKGGWVKSAQKVTCKRCLTGRSA
jgi:hypothetical protein